MTSPASDVYEIVLEEAAAPKRFLRSLYVLITSFFASLTNDFAPVNPGGTIVSVRRIDTGAEAFRHIEDLGDDEAHLIDSIRTDLATMTVEEFDARWVD